MTIHDEDENLPHGQAVFRAGAKGAIYGLGLAAVLLNSIKKRKPIAYQNYGPSIKPITYTLSAVSMAAVFADNRSVEFRNLIRMSKDPYKAEQLRLDNWNSKSLLSKFWTIMGEHKNLQGVGMWAAALWGSTKIVYMDTILTTARKAVQAKVNALLITFFFLSYIYGINTPWATPAKSDLEPVADD